MRKTFFAVIALSILVSPLAMAQEQQEPMTFFVTSRPIGSGGDLGGLAGADAHCQSLAAAAGAGGRTWRAYLSTQGAGAVNARDRIGSGPWHNANGVRVAANVADLHGDNQRDRNYLYHQTALDENGNEVPGRYRDDSQPQNMHDILTGSDSLGRALPAGEDRTCNNWTSSSTGRAMVGHHDRSGGNTTSWNMAHPSRTCSQSDLNATGGNGLLYCFAAQ
jgi:hypothetical protein